MLKKELFGLCCILVRCSIGLTVIGIEAGVDDVLGSDLLIDPELVGDRVEGEAELRLESNIPRSI